MNQPKELTELERAVTAFQNLAERSPEAVRGLKERLAQLAEDISKLLQ
ncbi:hypothetical protein [Paenibacillus sp. FSL H7-689]|nr:hypothetical protein [Paenibacillus sp. FSL H7-689]